MTRAEGVGAAVMVAVALAAALVALASLTGCVGGTDRDTGYAPRFDAPAGVSAYVVTDGETGAEYLLCVTASGCGVCPLSGGDR